MQVTEDRSQDNGEDQPPASVDATESASRDAPLLAGTSQNNDEPQPSTSSAVTSVANRGKSDSKSQDIEVIKEVYADVPAIKTGQELKIMFEKLIHEEFAQDQSWKESKIALINGIIKEILELKSDYIESQHFCNLTSAFAEDLLDAPNTAKLIRLADYIDELRSELHRIKSNKESRERMIKLIAEFNEQKKVNPSLKPPQELTKKENKKKEAKIKRLRKKMVKLQKQLDKYQNKELSLEDLDDDHSSWVMETSIQRQILNCYNQIQELSGLKISSLRPLAKKLIYNGSGSDEVDKKITDFVNNYLRTTKPRYSCPSYHDIVEVLKQCSYVLEMDAPSQELFCKRVFQEIGQEIKKKRQLETSTQLLDYEMDALEHLPLEASDKQPEETDEELRKKLEENDKIKKDPEEVIREWKEKQEKLTPEEIATLETEADSQSMTSQSSADDADSDVEASPLASSDDEEEDEEDQISINGIGDHVETSSNGTEKKEIEVVDIDDDDDEEEKPSTSTTQSGDVSSTSNARSVIITPIPTPTTSIVTSSTSGTRKRPSDEDVYPSKKLKPYEEGDEAPGEVLDVITLDDSDDD